MKPTPLHPLRPSRRLMRTPRSTRRWADIGYAATGAVCLVILTLMFGVGCVPV